jgi:hypothetical protein
MGYRRVTSRNNAPADGVSLSRADETDHDRPRIVPVEVRDQELRLRSPEVRDPLAAPHKVGGLGLCPRTLGLIEDDDAVVWGTGGADAFIPEVMNV